MRYEETLTQKLMTDEEVLALSLKAPQEFTTIVVRYESAFLRRARAIIGHREEVEDVVAETFTKIYFNASRFRRMPGASFRSWAYRILFNTAISYYNKLKRRRGDLTANDFDLSLLPDRRELQARERAEWRDLIASVLYRLPATTARVLRQFFLEDRSQAEIAEREGISVAAVKTRLHRAKQEFKKHIAPIEI